jgi:hypothetical protein
MEVVMIEIIIHAAAAITIQFNGSSCARLESEYWTGPRLFKFQVQVELSGKNEELNKTE